MHKCTYVQVLMISRQNENHKINFEQLIKENREYENDSVT